MHIVINMDYGRQMLNNKLDCLYKECIDELKSVGIDLDNKEIGKIDVKINTRASKRYGCCKQEDPDKKSAKKIRVGRKIYIKYNRYKKHHIEVSKWVMDLDESIIKNTIMHELIHCLPYCNDHGDEFKKYASYINDKLGYDIARVGNKKEDYSKSNIEYKEKEKEYKYKIVCQKCGQIYYRQRLKRNLLKRYRCSVCGGKLDMK